MKWSYEEAFSRHAGLITPAEQRVLRKSRVAIAGMGGVGGAHLIALARLGIASFSIADNDHFEIANFNRQYGARVSDLGQPKVEVMAAEARQINPDVHLRLFDRGIDLGNIDEFLDGANLFVDGIDFFELPLRQALFTAARRKGICAITAAPLGFSVAWLVFSPQGMRFEDYFDLRAGLNEVQRLARFFVGLAPAALHRPYLDLDAIDSRERTGPSSGLACQLCASVVATECLKLLAGRGEVAFAPAYRQFDPYLGQLRRGRLWRGNRHPLQQIKCILAARYFGELPRAGVLGGQTS